MESLVTVALAQMGPADADMDTQVARLSAIAEKAARAGAQLCCFPELAPTDYFPATRVKEPLGRGLRLDDPRLAPLRRQAADAGMGLVLGYGETDGVVLRNTAAVFRGDGELLGQYRKMHLPANFFGASGDVSNFEKFYFQPGDLGFPVFDMGWGRLGVQICYDRNFPEGFRCLALAGAEIIVIPTCAPTFGVPWGVEMWEMLCRVRAYENGCFVLGVNKVGREGDSEFFGHSLVASPFGGPPVAVAQGSGDEALIVTIDLADVRAARTRRPFMRDRRPEFYRPISGT
jgi:predicted amidohydrolase